MKNTAAVSRAEVDKYAAAERDLCETHAEALAAIADSEAGLGDEALRAVLGEAMPGRAAKAASEAGYLIIGIEQAVGVARERRAAAITALHRAQAAEKRAEAVALRADAAERRKTTDKLLDQLRTFEGVEYEPKSSVGPLRTQATAMGPVVVRAGDETITLATLRRAAELEAEATQLERQEPARNFGAVGTLAEILAALAAEPLTLGPSPLELAWWIAEAEAAPRAKWSRARRQMGLADDDEAWCPHIQIAYRAGSFSGSVVTAPPAAVGRTEDVVPVPAVLERAS